MKSSFPPDTPYDNHDDELTLTELKEKAWAAQDLGREIVNLTDRQLRYIPLEGLLREAIMEARRLTHRGSVVRQLQFIGKIMRTVDQAPLIRGLEDARSSKPFLSPVQALARQWADKVLLGHDEITQFLALAPHAERTRLSQLTRQLLKNRKQSKTDGGALLAYIEAQLQAGDGPWQAVQHRPKPVVGPEADASVASALT